MDRSKTWRQGLSGHKYAAAIALTCAALCWGFAPIATRELVAHIEPFHVLLLRFGIASLIFSPILLRFRAWQPSDRLKMLGCGLIAMLGYYVPVTIGGKYIPSGVTGLLVTTQTLWMAGLAIIFLRERLTVAIMAGIAVSTLGIALLLGGAMTQSLSGDWLLGGLLTLCGALMWSLYSLAIRPLAKKYGALACTALTAIIGLAPLLFSISPTLSNEFATMTPGTAGALVVLAVGSTVIGNFLWNFGLARVTGIQASLFLYLIPLISVIGGVLLLRETVGIQTIISGLLILGGVAIAQLIKTPPVAITRL